ncbi:MAG TPA: invasion associated locus B family protein [Xanthobacteraceae bacterium]|nr:invasion associated locus B family protein [Xanthobacteraceae bacterium]
MAAAALAAVSLVAAANAQAPATKPKPKTPKPPTAQAQQPAPPAQAPPAQAPVAAAIPTFVSTPWVKLCEAQPKKICVTRTLLRTTQGAPAALAEFAEPEGSPKILRITLPLGMLLEYGTRILIDQTQQPYATAKFVTCLEGCITFYQVSDDLQDKMKKGKTLNVQAVNLNNAPMNFPLSLENFAKAIDGPPTDPKAYEEQQKKLQEELQKRAQPQAAPPAQH